MDAQTQLYLQYYKNQSGGQLNVFAGARRAVQTGNGALGGILSKVWRFLFPIAAQAGSAFLNETLSARNTGKTWGDAAKGALAPAVSSAIDNAIKSASSNEKTAPAEPQSGGKRKQKHKRKPLLEEQQDTVLPKHRRPDSTGYKRALSPTAADDQPFTKQIKFRNF